MFAVVEISGKQYKVTPNSEVLVDLLDEAIGQDLQLDKVLLTSSDDGSDCKVGQPYTGSVVSAKVLERVQGDKIRIFKFRPKKRYARTQGHRQDYTILQIGEIK
ncbi:MAG: 50S ribosomal protein L21 [Candidatus Altimarinota bacterium]